MKAPLESWILPPGSFAGRRFQALNGLYIEPKAGGTFGSVELDDSNTDQSFQDGLGTEFALTLGYVL